VERAALSVLGREDQTLESLQVPGAPQIHFEPEERPLLVMPGKLVVSEPQRDELARDRLRVNVAFTLPPGAYATLVVKRLFWWTLAPRVKERPAPPPRRPTPEEVHAQRKATGFLARQRARKAARHRG
jgi:tRNA pseudouridine13 synthase